MDQVPIVVVNGSVRPGNYTAMACALVVDELQKNPRVRVEWFRPGAGDLPLPGTGAETEFCGRMREAVREAVGVVLATPEYHGSYSSVVKLAIECLEFPSALAGKPVALLGVAAGSIGAIKALEHLRGVVSHVGAVALPLAVSVANVQKTFDPGGRCLDPAVEKLVRRVGVNLWQYIERNVCPAVTIERILREGVARMEE
jgi:NAD(P)H-dependent FMN reductase